MARRFPLEMVRQVARQRTEDAQRALEVQAARLRQAESKLADLARFREEYRTTRLDAAARGIEAGRLREYGAFILRLEEAVESQRLDVERTRATWSMAHAHWLELRSREQAFDKLAERHAAAEQLREARQDQKAQDEYARRRAGAMKSDA